MLPGKMLGRQLTFCAAFSPARVAHHVVRCPWHYPGAVLGGWPAGHSRAPELVDYDTLKPLRRPTSQVVRPWRLTRAGAMPAPRRRCMLSNSRRLSADARTWLNLERMGYVHCEWLSFMQCA